MFKKILSIFLVIAFMFICSMQVIAVDVQTEQVTEIQTAIPTEHIEQSSNTVDGLSVLIFVTSICAGVMLGKAFSFWKW